MEINEGEVDMPIRFDKVLGFDGRKNDVLYYPPSAKSEKNTIVVYFGGDIQDFLENMEKHHEYTKYRKWNLNNVAVMLGSYFKESHIVVVHPCRYENRSFSCFDNFVISVQYGIPNHTPTYNGLWHLEALLNSIASKLNAMHEEKEQSSDQSQSKENGGKSKKKDNLDFSKADLIVIGFSKGCVVLNQFIYEFHYANTLTPDDRKMGKLISRVTDMYFLDGGHFGKKNTWITSVNLLETLARLGIRIHVHVTAYQVLDNNRPWIGREEDQFTKQLLKLGAPIERQIHFEDEEELSIETHFEVLSVFKTP